MQLVSARGPLAIAMVGLVALAVAMGIGRFAFTPLLPVMLLDGSVTLAQGSWLATLNYIGYFFGAALCLFIRPDGARMVRIGLVATAVLTLAMAVPGELWLWNVWRTASGVFSAFVMVYASAWCMQRLAETGKSSWTGIIFCGPGIGIALTGLAISGLAALDAHAGWGWALFGVLAAVLTVVVWPVFTSVPAAPGAASAALPVAPRLNAEAWGLTIGYGLAGFGYIITATFLPVIARQVLSGTVWADLFWPMFGVGSAIGAFATLKLGTGHDNRKLLTIAFCMQALGVVIAVIWPTVAGFALSSVLAGLPFTALVSFAMAEARRLWGPQAPRLMGLMTAVYGLGQIAGPPLTAALVVRTGGFSLALVCAASALFIGALIFFVMRQRFVS